MQSPFNSFLIFSLLMFFANSAASSSAETPPNRKTIEITTPPISETGRGLAHYFTDLLTLALEAESPGIQVKISEVNRAIAAQKRHFDDVADQRFDVMWTVTSKHREEVLIPIHIPLQKGLMGLRIFLIRESNQTLFDSIQNINDLKKLKAGSGASWPDTEILKANNLPTVVGDQYEYLFPMLVNKRFDYFPRGATEVFSEIQSHPNLKIEEKLVLAYPSAIYYFVNPKKPELAKRIDTGLNIMLNNGSFDNYFNEHPLIKPVIENLNLKNRQIIRLKNPLLSNNVPLQEKKLWLITLDK